MNTRANDYYVFTARRGEHPERWSWEIRRKSNPLGVRLTADGFQSEKAALFAGQLVEPVHGLRHALPVLLQRFRAQAREALIALKNDAIKGAGVLLL